jgi:pectin methylesterase-like acyl-CoA thioesterase
MNMAAGASRKLNRRPRILIPSPIEAMECRVLFSTPTLPTIPAAVFNVTSYGAVGNGSTDNTTAIQAAINAASAAGGGTVEIPAASQPYESGPLTLKNSINLQVDSGAELQMLPYGTYPLANGATSYASLITANTLSNIEVSGGGVIDGQGSAWWTAYSAGQITATRPAMLAIASCTNVLVAGVTLTNAPNVHISFEYISTNVTVNGITINTPNNTPNTDGIDCTGTNVLIENSYISDGDDNIAFGGRGSSNMTVTNCSFGTGHGLSIGSFTGGGLNGLTVTNCYFNGTLNGIHGKTNRTRGGVVQNLTYSNIVMANVANPIVFDDYYFVTPHPPANEAAQPVTSNTPYWNNVSVSNLYATGVTTAPIDLWGLPEAPLNTWTFSGVTSTGSGGTSNVINNATGVSLINSVFSPTYTTYNGGVTVTGGGPSITTAAMASAVTGATVNLSTLATDPAGASALTYTWAPVGDAPAPVTFSANGTNAAKATTATFTKAGTYVFQVVVTDPSGLTTTSAVNVTVSSIPVLTAIKLTPASATIAPGAMQQFTAVAYDQFGNALATQPSFTWTTSAGSITSTGNFTAPLSNTTATISATSGSISGTATVTVQASILTSVKVTPVTSTMVPADTQQFTAVAYDQNGVPLATQPTFTWTTSTGTITSGGSYTAPIADASATITATTSSISGTATVTVAVPRTVVLTVNPALAASSTNFQTIQAAINDVPTGNTTPYDIQIAAGTYATRLTIAAGQNFITLDGGNNAVTVQAGSDESTTPIVQAAASNFTMENITINDTYGTSGPSNALESTGDRQVYLNDSILGYQDTLLANKAYARLYFKNCTISGSADFIYGAGTCIFDTCNINQRVGGVSLTAPATPQTAYGFIFVNSHLINGGSIAAGTTALSRAWTSPYGEAAYIDTNMDNMISAVGWTNFSATTSYTSTERYLEYGSYGAGAAGYLANPSQRASQAVSLTATQAAQYANLTTLVPNFATIFNGWNPTAVGGTTPVVFIGANGVWETATNWNTGIIPSAGQAVFVTSGSVTLTSTPSIDSLTVGTANGGATLNISSGASLNIGGLLTTAGTSGTPTHINDIGGLTAASVLISDTADQIHITNNAPFSVTQGLSGAWPAGTIYTDQGTLSVPNLGGYASGPIVDLGAVSGSTGTWNVTAGAAQYPQAINTGAGTANINISGGTIYGTYGPSFGGAGSGGTVTMTQTGGTAEFLNANLGYAKGTYIFNDSGGTIEATGTSYDWLLGDGSNAVSTWNTSASAIVSLNDLYVGRQGTGTFNQTGGAVTLNQTSSAQIPADAGLRLGWSAGGSGTYVVSGGSLAIDNGGVTLGYDPTSGSSYGVGTLHIIGAAAGAIPVVGNYTQSSKSVLEDDVEPGGISTVGVTGNVTFTSGATVNPVLETGATGGSYTLMTWTGTLTGSPTLAAGAVSKGWTLSIVGNSLVATALPSPTVATAATASPSALNLGSTTTLSVLGSDGTGTSGLTYTWTASAPGTVTYTANGTTASSTTVAGFSTAGSYSLTVTITNVAGESTTSSVSVNVLPTWVLATSAATWNPTTNVLSVTGPTTLTADPGAVEPVIQASGSSAVIALNPSSGTDIHLGGLTLTGGARATETSLGSARSLANYHLLVIGSPGATSAPTFNIDSTSTLDLADNDMAILYGTGTSPLPLVQDALQSAYDTGKWDKPGLTSSVAPATKGATGLGYATSTELGDTTFDGLTLGGNAVLVKYTLMGDTTLSGTVSGSDYNTVLANYDASGDWCQGNFDYSGTYSAGTFTNGQIAGQDYNTVLGQFDNSLSSYLAAGAGAPALAQATAGSTVALPTSADNNFTATAPAVSASPNSGQTTPSLTVSGQKSTKVDGHPGKKIHSRSGPSSARRGPLSSRLA